MTLAILGKLLNRSRTGLAFLGNLFLAGRLMKTPSLIKLSNLLSLISKRLRGGYRYVKFVEFIHIFQMKYFRKLNLRSSQLRIKLKLRILQLVRYLQMSLFTSQKFVRMVCQISFNISSNKSNIKESHIPVEALYNNIVNKVKK